MYSQALFYRFYTLETSICVGPPNTENFLDYRKRGKR